MRVFSYQMKKYEKYHALLFDIIYRMRQEYGQKKRQNKKGENILLKKFVIVFFHMRKRKIVNSPNDF